MNRVIKISSKNIVIKMMSTIRVNQILLNIFKDLFIEGLMHFEREVFLPISDNESENNLINNQSQNNINKTLKNMVCNC